MKKREIVERLRAEAEEHVPDVAVDPAAARRGAPSDVIVLPRPRRNFLPLAAAAVALFLLLAILLPVLLVRGGGGLTTLVISINPSAELTVESGVVTKTKPLNRDAAVLLADRDLNGMTAEDACLAFAQLASDRRLIGADGVRIRVTGKDGAGLTRRIHSTLDALFAVGDLDDLSLSTLFDGYDEDAMEQFEDYVVREYGEKQQEYLERARALLQTYRADVLALDLTNPAAVQVFNQTYLPLGEDFLVEREEDDDDDDDDDDYDDDYDDDDDDDVRAELLEEYEEIMRLLDRDPQRAFEVLFKGFLELIEEEYDD